MTTFDLVIQNGTIVTAREILEADIGIKDGKIHSIGKNFSGHKYINAGGHLILPGAVDPHVHLQMPAGATTSSDNWNTGTTAAAFGGTTTVIDFIEPLEEQSLLEAFQERKAQADPQVVVDYALHMTLSNIIPQRMVELPEVIRAGMTSFKTYTTYDGMKLSDQAFLEMFHQVAQVGGLVMVHSENDAICDFAARELLAQGRLGPEAHPISRPGCAESEAIERVLSMASLTHTPVYIVHISTAQGAAALSRAQARGQNAFGETCPQYLLLTDREYSRLGFEGAKFVCAPPLRKENDTAALWDALSQNTIQTIGTDHCPFFFEGQKDLGKDSFNKIPGGIPGIEPRLALVYTYGVRTGKLTLNQWVDRCCTKPAEIFGLYPRKGTLMPGADADIVLFNPQLEQVLSHQMLHENVDYTPYEGFALKGFPVMTLLRGSVLVEDGQIHAKPGQGIYLKCELPRFNQQV